MKKIIAIVLLSTILFLGCQDPGKDNPFVGTWSLGGGLMIYTFEADMSCSAVGFTVATGGIYSYTETRLDITWPNGNTFAALYVINGDRMELSGIPPEPAFTMVLIRQ